MIEAAVRIWPSLNGDDSSTKDGTESPPVRASTCGVWLYLAFSDVNDFCGGAGDDASQPPAPLVASRCGSPAVRSLFKDSGKRRGAPSRVGGGAGEAVFCW